MKDVREKEKIKNITTKLKYMKKTILAISIFFVGCETTVDNRKTGEKFNGQPILMVVFDSCQYVYFQNGNASWGSHKGNCNNPIHKINN